MSRLKQNSIELSQTGIVLFPLSEYKNFENIQHIFLEGNKIQRLDDDFFPTFNQLKWLDIRNNELLEIPKSIAKHPCLEVLLLQGNRLQSLPIQIGSIPNLRGIQLAGNPLAEPLKAIAERGSSAVIKCFRSSWTNSTVTPIINTSCQIKSTTKTDSADVKVSKKKDNSKKVKSRKVLHSVCGLRKQTNNLKDCVRVTKIVGKPKHKAVVNILKDWNTLEKKLPDERKNENDVPIGPTSTPRVSSSDKKPNSIKSKESDKLEGTMVKSKFMTDTWLQRIKAVLEEQESELQRRRNKDALEKWKTEAKEEQIKRWAEYAQGDKNCEVEVPYGTDKRYKKIPSRKDLDKKEESAIARPSKLVAFNGEVVSSKIHSVLTLLQQIRRERNNRTLSMHAEKEMLANEIKKINELQRTLSSLKAINYNHSPFLTK